MSQNPKILQTNYLIMIRKKSPADELFVRKFRNFPVFSIIHIHAGINAELNSARMVTLVIPHHWHPEPSMCKPRFKRPCLVRRITGDDRRKNASSFLDMWGWTLCELMTSEDVDTTSTSTLSGTSDHCVDDTWKNTTVQN